MTNNDERHSELHTLLKACDEVLDFYAERGEANDVAAKLLRQSRQGIEERLQAAEEEDRSVAARRAREGGAAEQLDESADR